MNSNPFLVNPLDLIKEVKKENADSLDFYSALERKDDSVVCQCGKRSLLFVKDGEKSIYRYGYCKNCSTEEMIQARGFKVATHHPLTPVLFTNTDPARLHAKVRESLDWTPSIDKSGLLLHGTTGVGKSRAVWSIVNRIWMTGYKRNLNLSFVFLAMRDLEAMIEKSFDEHNHGEVIKKLCTTPLLVIDDLGKERLTSRMATDLFSIIDERANNCRATIITTNFNGSALIDRFPGSDKETGIALVRRLKDYYKIYGIGVDNA
jgi:DNA replication protein DnaC